MTGASPDHELIVANLIAGLGPQIRDKRSCRLYGSNLRTQIKKNGRYAYPDAIIVCGESQYGRGKTLLNPTIVFEILSPSTKNYDLGDKGTDYRLIASLQDILYVYQDQPRVTHVFRQDDQWIIKDYENLTEAVNFQSIGCSLSLSDIYDKVEFLSDEPFVDDEV
jgi:Uma2 family endonuclease